MPRQGPPRPRAPHQSRKTLTAAFPRAQVYPQQSAQAGIESTLRPSASAFSTLQPSASAFSTPSTTAYQLFSRSGLARPRLKKCYRWGFGSTLMSTLRDDFLKAGPQAERATFDGHESLQGWKSRRRRWQAVEWKTQAGAAGTSRTRRPFARLSGRAFGGAASALARK